MLNVRKVSSLILFLSSSSFLTELATVCLFFFLLELAKSSSLACTYVVKTLSLYILSSTSYTKLRFLRICRDVWRPTGTGDRNNRKIGENKLLNSKARFSPYAPVASGSKSGSSTASSITFGKCEKCRSTVSRAGAKFCQGEYQFLWLCFVGVKLTSLFSSFLHPCIDRMRL